jgi:xylulose-5-phosphate/fructose-6-phosphate phosphoketolase
VNERATAAAMLDAEERRLVDAYWRARAYTRQHGDHDPEIRDWTWPY